MAPMHKSIGIGHLSSDKFLSDKTNWVIPCLAEISDIFFILSSAFSKLSL